MGTQRRALVLNFDAEYELENPKGYSPSPKIVRQMGRLAESYRGALLATDVVVTPETRAQSLVGVQGLAWCPTPRAQALLARVGARPAPGPSLPVLQRVNDRRFGIEVQPDPLGARYVNTLAEALAHLSPPFPPHGYLTKRAFGFAGRGQRVMPGPAELTADDVGWVRNSLRRGPGLVIEPRVVRTLDCAVHGYVRASGEVSLGPPLIQHCDAHGKWLHTSPLAQGRAQATLTADERAELQASALRVAAALHEEGYYGPFGIDAFRFMGAQGELRFRPLVEVNARLTMGYVHSGLPLAE